MSLRIKGDDSAKLTKLELEKDLKSNNYYLNATYLVDNEYGVYEINYPKIILPVSKYNLPAHASEYTFGHIDNYVNLGFGNLPLDEVDGKLQIIKTIEEKKQTMTLSEIEEKLGYKINLVSENE